MTDDDANVSAELPSGTGRAYDASVRAEISKAGSDFAVARDGLRLRQSIRRDRKDVAAIGSEALKDRTAGRVRRTAELDAENRTAREIGRIIASEEGSTEAFAVSTVRTWRHRLKVARTVR